MAFSQYAANMVHAFMAVELAMAPVKRGSCSRLHRRYSSAGHLWCPPVQSARRDKPKFTGDSHCTGGILDQIKLSHAERRYSGAARTTGSTEMPEATYGMKNLLISVVEDDRFFRESMGRLMRSLGYTVEAFPSAAEFLASPRLAETACLIADVHMPGMTGIELYRRLVGAGYAIPTILVTAYPNHIDQDHALNDGVVCYLRKPVDGQHLSRCLRAALTSGETPEEDS
jgi:CheY-like chemotaxis protein